MAIKRVKKNLSAHLINRKFIASVSWLAVVCSCCGWNLRVLADDRPNVILIVCDDLNDYVEGFGGHPQAKTPNLLRLAKSGTRFTQAHCNIPICGPSRASLFTGIYPHHSGCYGFTKWDSYEVLKNSRTLMDHFRANGYRTLGTGKLMHHLVRQEWQQYGNRADYGPFAFDGEVKQPHPDVPAPFSSIGPVDGSFGPLLNLANRQTKEGKPLKWRTGGWANERELKVSSQDNRDLTADELNGKWAVEQIKALASKSAEQPFFMGVGFIRPHTPLIVPERFFQQFPLEDLSLPVIKNGDVEDTFARSVRGLPTGKEPESPRTEDMGLRLFSRLVESYPSKGEGLKRFIQAYLASVASVDEQIGLIIDAVDRSSLKNNTLIVVTSDHGWGMGEKDYLYKNSLWQESTQVPLIIRAPGISKPGTECESPVSLVDLYPTLVELCQLSGETKKSDKGHPLDGFSLKPLLLDPEAGEWRGPAEALTALYKWRPHYDPSEESYALRAKNWRYIRYGNGKEELYHTQVDPHEWHNLAGNADYAKQINRFRSRLKERLPQNGVVPNQPKWKPKQARKPKPIGKPKQSAVEWKEQYFKKHPNADVNRDGILSWPELKTYRDKFDPPRSEKSNAKKTSSGKTCP